MNILIVEDHLPTAESLTFYLQSKHHVVHATSCNAARIHLNHKPCDLILLDLGLPDGSGLEFCEPNLPDHIPTMVISGNAHLHTKITALDAGADDYILKPFSPAEVLARINALSRRFTPRSTTTLLTVGQLKLEEGRAEYLTQQAQLTQTEAQVLRQLMQTPSQVIPKSQLPATTSLEVHIKNIRKKLEVSKDHRLIETIYGVGYRLNPY
jgi:DNA-binding response OmpR family regulator